MENKIQPEIKDKRLLCIDALRGFDMLWIIGGSGVMVAFAEATGFGFLRKMPLYFDHTWGEFYFYDLIMPLFLFIVGVVMPISFSNRLARGDSKKQMYIHIARRVIILYFLGLVASGNLLSYDITRLSLWTDTLHAIAFGYFASSIIVLELSNRWQIIVASGLLLAYWGVMALIPIPGYGAGIYEPDLNLALYIDNAILGRFQEGYGWTYIITNMTFVSNVMLGVFAGKILQSNKDQMKKAGLLALIGIGCLVIAKIWAIWFPIIHHLWTSTLVLYAGGFSFLLLSIFYIVIDVWGFRKWAFPFAVIGINAIAVYVATKIFNFSRIGNVFVGGLSKYLENWFGFIEALTALTVVWLILYWMYRKKTFVKI